MIKKVFSIFNTFFNLCNRFIIPAYQQAGVKSEISGLFAEISFFELVFLNLTTRLIFSDMLKVFIQLEILLPYPFISCPVAKGGEME